MGYSFDLDVFEVFALDREDVASLVLWVVTLAVPTTFQFHSKVGVLSTKANHLAKVVLGYLVMSRSSIILQVV